MRDLTDGHTRDPLRAVLGVKHFVNVDHFFLRPRNLHFQKKNISMTWCAGYTRSEDGSDMTAAIHGAYIGPGPATTAALRASSTTMKGGTRPV